ncbi:MAG TPA: hypothetical protein VF533_00485 [Solirubrobacteraceae bacterium]|jgi:hypothetical protein
MRSIGKAADRPARARAAAAAAVAAIAAGVALVLRRMRPAADSEPAAPGQASWRCECGQAFRVSGAGRHQVFWLDGAAEADPVLGDRCPACERPLAPAEEPARAAA